MSHQNDNEQGNVFSQSFVGEGKWFSPRSTRNVLWIALVLTLLQALRLLIFPASWVNPVEVSVEMRSDVDAPAQLYFNRGSGFREDDSRYYHVHAGNEFITYREEIPTGYGGILRVDGPAEVGEFAIRSIHLANGKEEKTWTASELLYALYPQGDVEILGYDKEQDAVVYRSTGIDPRFHLQVPEFSSGLWLKESLARIALLAFLSFLVLAGVFLLIRLVLSILLEMAKTAGMGGYRTTCLWFFGSIGCTVLFFQVAHQNEKELVPQHLAGHNLYYHLTEAYLGGSLALKVQPKPDLLALENPFDPAVNRHLRLHDASLHNEKYYVYFGPAPVLAMYLPWLYWTDNPLPDRWAAASLASGTVILLWLLLLRAVSLQRRKHQQAAKNSSLPREDEPTKYKLTFSRAMGAFLLIALGSCFLYVLIRSVVYEVAILSALFWTTLAIVLVAEQLQKGRGVAAGLLAGVCLGLAMASRHSYVLVAAALLGMAALYYLYRYRTINRSVLLPLIFMALPIFVAGCLLLWHNQVRFDTPTEFGHTYQIGKIDPATVTFMAGDNFFYNSFLNLFHKPDWFCGFPHVSAERVRIPEFLKVPSTHIEVESALGILWANPLVFFLPAGFLWVLIHRRSTSPYFFWLLTLYSLLVAIGFLVIALFSYAVIRYCLDYLPWVNLLCCLLWLATPATPRWSKILDVFVWLGILYTVAFHFSITLSRFPS